MSKKSTKRNTGSGRPKPVAAKAGVTMNPKRRYGCGGRIKRK